MMMRSSSPRAHWLALCLMLAVILRALVPMGYMPVAQDGGLRMVICTANGAVSVDAKHSPADEIRPDGGCLFAPAGFVHDGAVAPTAWGQTADYTVLHAAIPATLGHPSSAGTYTSARAPPRSVVI